MHYLVSILIFTIYAFKCDLNNSNSQLVGIRRLYIEL